MSNSDLRLSRHIPQHERHANADERLSQWQFIGHSDQASLLLNRRTRHRAERAEHAAVAQLRAQQRVAGRALVVELAGVGGHGFLLGMATVRAGQHRLEDEGAHRGVNSARWTDSQRWSWPWSAPPAGPCRHRR
jgi:hypothetical protein